MTEQIEEELQTTGPVEVEAQAPALVENGADHQVEEVPVPMEMVTTTEAESSQEDADALVVAQEDPVSSSGESGSEDEPVAGKQEAGAHEPVMEDEAEGSLEVTAVAHEDELGEEPEVVVEPEGLVEVPEPKRDLKAWFASLENSLNMLFMISLGLLALSFLVLYHFGPNASSVDEKLFSGFCLLLGLVWAILALLVLGYTIAGSDLRRADTSGTLNPRLEQSAVSTLGIGLFVGVIGVISETEELLVLAVALVLTIPLQALLAFDLINPAHRLPALMLTLASILLIPGLMAVATLLSGDEVAMAYGFLVAAGGAMFLMGGNYLRYPERCLYPWVLGALGMASLLGFQYALGGFLEGSLVAAGGAGAMMGGALLTIHWRRIELNQRAEALAAGEQALAQDRPVEALAQLEVAFQLAARDGVLLQEPRFWALKGTALTSQRKYRRAMVYLGVALELDPTDELIWFERGKLYATLKRWDGAAESFTRAVSRKHDFLEAWMALGEAQLQREAYREALTAFTRVTKLEPRELKAWMGVGRAHAAMGQVRQAVQAFDTAIRLEPETLAPHKAKAKVYYTLKLWEKAEQAYESVIQLDRRSSEGWWKLAGCYLELRKPQMALVALNNFLELRPDNMEGLLRRAAIHYDEGEYGEAISDVHLALDQEPENKEAQQLKEIVLGRLSTSGGWR